MDKKIDPHKNNPLKLYKNFEYVFKLCLNSATKQQAQHALDCTRYKSQKPISSYRCTLRYGQRSSSEEEEEQMHVNVWWEERESFIHLKTCQASNDMRERENEKVSSRV